MKKKTESKHQQKVVEHGVRKLAAHRPVANKSSTGNMYLTYPNENHDRPEGRPLLTRGGDYYDELSHHHIVNNILFITSS